MVWQLCNGVPLGRTRKPGAAGRALGGWLPLTMPPAETRHRAAPAPPTATSHASAGTPDRDHRPDRPESADNDRAIRTLPMRESMARFQWVATPRTAASASARAAAFDSANAIAAAASAS